METADEKENCESTEENQETGVAEVKTSEKPKSGVLENRSLEIGKTEVRKSEKPKYRGRENRP